MLPYLSNCIKCCHFTNFLVTFLNFENKLQWNAWRFQQSVKICFILLEMSYKVLKVVKIESCQDVRLPNLKVAKM